MELAEGDAVEYSAEAGRFEACTVALSSTASVPPTPGRANTILLRHSGGDAAPPFQASLRSVRPVPPPSPVDVETLAVGAPVEALTYMGWCRGHWLAPFPGSAAPLSVQLTDGSMTSVTTANLRLARDWADGIWTTLVADAPPAAVPAAEPDVAMAEAPAAAAVAELAPTDVPTAEAPPAAAVPALTDVAMDEVPPAAAAQAALTPTDVPIAEAPPAAADPAAPAPTDVSIAEAPPDAAAVQAALTPTDGAMDEAPPAAVAPAPTDVTMDEAPPAAAAAQAALTPTDVSIAEAPPAAAEAQVAPAPTDVPIAEAPPAAAAAALAPTPTDPAPALTPTPAVAEPPPAAAEAQLEPEPEPEPEREPEPEPERELEPEPEPEPEREPEPEPEPEKEPEPEPEVAAEVSKEEPRWEPAAPSTAVAREIYPVGGGVEVTSFEDGLRGSWYKATVVAAAAECGTIRVRYAVNGVSGPEEEEVNTNRLRPLPPQIATAEIKSLLGKDDELELFFSQGWWDVVVLEVKKATYLVVAPEYDKKHTVAPKALRPRWSFDVESRASDSASEGWSLSVGGQSYTLAEWRQKAAAAAEESRVAAEVAAAEAAEASAALQPLTAEAVAEAAAAAERETAEEVAEEEALDAAALASRVAHFCWGMAVEVRPTEEGYAGAWCAAEVLKAVPETNELLISMVDEDGDTGAGRETARVARCRPAPPRLDEAASAAWLESLVAGESLEFWYDNAWWKAEVENRAGNAGAITVKSPSYGSRHRAPLTHLRPRFTWVSPAEGWSYAQGGAQIALPASDAVNESGNPVSDPIHICILSFYQSMGLSLYICVCMCIHAYIDRYRYI